MKRGRTLTVREALGNGRVWRVEGAVYIIRGLTARRGLIIEKFLGLRPPVRMLESAVWNNLWGHVFIKKILGEKASFRNWWLCACCVLLRDDFADREQLPRRWRLRLQQGLQKLAGG